VPGAIIALLILFNLVQVLPGQRRAYAGYNKVSADSLRRVSAAGLDRAPAFVALQPAYPRRDFD
jgi:hypothetical protein